MASDPHDAMIGKAIRVHRIAARMSQTDLGKHLGVTFQQVQKYERGANRVSAGRLLTISNVLKVPVLTFYGPSKVSFKNESPLDFLEKRDAFKLAEAFDKITSQRVRSSIVALVKDIAEPE